MNSIKDKEVVVIGDAGIIDNSFARIIAIYIDVAVERVAYINNFLDFKIAETFLNIRS